MTKSTTNTFLTTVSRTRLVILHMGSYVGFLAMTLGLFSLVNRVFLQVGFAFYAAIALLLIMGFYMWRADPLPGMPRTKGVMLFLLSAASLVLANLPSFYAAYLMSGGSYPAVFFDVDSSYHFSQVLSFLQSPAYPPESLNNVGVFFRYHYGSQLLAAELSRDLNVTPHFAYFALVPCLFFLSSIFCLYHLFARYSGVLVKLALFFVPMCSSYFFFNDWEHGNVLLGIENFNGGFPHIGTFAAIYSLIFLIYLYEIKPSSRWSFLLIMLLPSYSLLYKSPHIFLFGAFALGYLCISACMRELDPARLICLLIAMCVFVFVYKFASTGVTDFSFVGLFSKLDLNRYEILRILAFFLIPACLLIFTVNRDTWARIFPYLLAALLPMTIYLSFDLTMCGSLDRNLKQILYLVPFMLYFAFVILFMHSQLHTFLKVFILLPVIMGQGAPFLYNRIYNLREIVRNPEQWHEFVDNRSLTECLKHIPVKGALLVTNDLRYPANNFSRAQMQMQIPAIFGHKMFAGNARWEKCFVDKERFKAQEILIRGSENEINRMAKEYGWTHGILFRRQPFTKGKWHIICENSDMIIVSY